MCELLKLIPRYNSFGCGLELRLDSFQSFAAILADVKIQSQYRLLMNGNLETFLGIPMG